MYRIVVVCTGNVCRSAMTQVMLRHGLRERLKDGAAGLDVSSAGTLGLIGEPIHPLARDELLAGPWPAAEEREADLRAFRARRLEPELLADADLVLTAGREHRAAAVAMAPHLVRRAFTVIELARLARQAAREVLAEEDWLEPPPQRRATAVVARAARLRASVRPLHAEDDDIPDPMGQPPAVFREVADRLQAAVDEILDGLVGR